MVNNVLQRYRDNYMAVIRLGLPILVGQLGMIVTGFVDNIMVGRYSTEALASASFVNGVFNTAVLTCIGFTYGITPLVGAMFARGESGRIGRLMRNALFLNLLFAVLVTLIMWGVYLNVDRLGQPEELLPIIRPYFQLYLAGVIPIALFNVFAQWSYGIRRTRMPMWIILAANVVNIIGNYLLIYGNFGCPELGLTGAGIATLAARLLCPAVLIAMFFTRREFSCYKAGFTGGTLNRRDMGVLNRTSWPVSLQLMFETGSFSAAAIMAGWLGAIELAAFQVMLIIGTLGFCVYYSIASAIAVLVANAAGTGDKREMRRASFAGYHIILLFAAIASLTFIFLGEPLIGLFTTDGAVIAMSLSLIFPMVLYQLGDATQITFANALRGTSQVMPVVWIALISYVIVGLPTTYILGFPAGLGLYGLYLSFSVSLFLAAALFLLTFLKYSRP